MERSEGETFRNVVVGSAVGFLLSLAVTPVVGFPAGGGVAGYLQQRSGVGGARVGSMVGILASLPYLAVFFVVIGLGVAGALARFGSGGTAVLIVLLGSVLGLLAGTVLGGVGGVVGGILTAE